MRPGILTHAALREEAEMGYFEAMANGSNSLAPAVAGVGTKWGFMTVKWGFRKCHCCPSTP